MDATEIEARIAALGYVLPVPAMPIASFIPYTVQNDLVCVSGQLPLGPEGLRHVGQLGKEIGLADGQAAAALCALNVIAQVKAACGGDLGLVRRCLRLGIFVNATPDFTAHPEVANGASDLMVHVFGEAGQHARAAIGVGSLPRGVCVEVEALFLVS